MNKAIVIGAGAAGMMAAITAAKMGCQVTIIEQNEKIGKKLFITGKGRCNITNDSDVENLLANVMVNKKFLYSAFYSFNSRDMMDTLTESGLRIKVERGHRVFPESDKSSDVIAALNRMMQAQKVKVLLNTKVTELMTKIDGDQQIVTGVVLDDHTKLYADSVLIATGGLSYPATGSTGDGFAFAKATNHQVTPLYPSLVPFNVEEEWVKELQGLSLRNVSLKLKSGKKVIYDDMGEMLFTHFGISGPLVLSASPVCIKHLQGKTLTAEIDLKPALSDEQLDARLLKDFQKYANKQFHNALADLLPAKLIPIIVGLSGIDPYKKVNEITKVQRNELLTIIKHLKMTITSTRSFREAIITRGGVSVKDINPSTMESKKCKNLYFAGEVIDVDALTGGYNLQIAWSTGYLAGLSMSQIETEV